MKKQVAIIGYGNIGKSVLESLKSSEDFNIAGIVEPRGNHKNNTNCPELAGIKIYEKIEDMDKPDVAILCIPSRIVPDIAENILKMGINCVDCFDIHTDILKTKLRLDVSAKENNAVSITAAGWDPGTDSMVRSMLEAIAPKGLTYTNFGPGMSMGHSVAAKGIDGVRDALSMTIPLGTSIHRRMVYIEMEDGYDFDTVAQKIKTDEYFAHDETHVIKVDSVDALKDMGHGVHMIRKGVSGGTQNQIFEFKMSINNPALTGQVLVCVARASFNQQPGCYTMIEIPIIDMIYGDRDTLIKKLV